MRILLALCALLGCSPAAAAPNTWILGVTRVPEGDVVDLVLEKGRVAAVHPAGTQRAPKGAIDGAGRFAFPAAIDSHVHIAYHPVGSQLAAAGIAAVVDHAAPEAALSEDHGVETLHAGPMLAAPSGYPTTSWGRDGYGHEVVSGADATAFVDRLHAAGAGLLKVSFEAGPDLSDDVLQAAIDRAHALDMKVTAHALSGSGADRAARLGVDVLSHTPVQSMSGKQAAAWSGRAVVSTLGAFGGSAAAIANLRLLREAGAQILYGTDLGNTRRARIDEVEVGLLRAAGLDNAAILTALTVAPAAYWGFEGLGSLTPGSRASLLLLSEDPREDPTVLSAPDAVWIDGLRRAD
jgi:imidazolonepropionase-like amidohydrolase